MAAALLNNRSREAFERRERLSAAATLVADHLVCPCCLVAYTTQLLDALWARQSTLSARVPQLMEAFAQRTGAAGWLECRVSEDGKSELHHELHCDEMQRSPTVS